MTSPAGSLKCCLLFATLLGSPGVARHVGYALAGAFRAEEPVPWQRVINARGGISARGDLERGREQRELLEADEAPVEGAAAIHVGDGQADLYLLISRFLLFRRCDQLYPLPVRILRQGHAAIRSWNVLKFRCRKIVCLESRYKRFAVADEESDQPQARRIADAAGNIVPTINNTSQLQFRSAGLKSRQSTAANGKRCELFQP